MYIVFFEQSSDSKAVLPGLPLHVKLMELCGFLPTIGEPFTYHAPPMMLCFHHDVRSIRSRRPQPETFEITFLSFQLPSLGVWSYDKKLTNREPWYKESAYSYGCA